MSNKKEIITLGFQMILIALLALIIFIPLQIANNSKEPYIDSNGRNASQIARNEVIAQQYLPAIVQWHMNSQVKIDNGYFEDGKLDYHCAEEGWKIKRMECPVSGIGYRLTYSPKGKILHFEWDYSKEEA